MAQKTFSLLGRQTYRINHRIVLNVPTVGAVRGENEKDERDFWQEVGMFTASSYDLPVELDDMGLDFTQVSDYLLFSIQFMMWQDEKKRNKCKEILFKDFSLWDLEISENNGETVFVDMDNQIIIDEDIYNSISDVLTFVTGYEKPKRIKYDPFLKKRYIEDKRKEKERKAKRKQEQGNEKSESLDGIILRLVCNSNFPYNFKTVNQVTLFDLIFSLKQIEKDNNVTDLMQSRLAGADLKNVPPEQLSRFVL